jgi:type I restriction enzyme S subunit
VRSLCLEIDDVKCISPEIAGQYSRTFLQGGEILITIRGTLGGIVVTPLSCSGFNISREVAMIALADMHVGQATALFIASPPIQNWITTHTRGIAYTGINIQTLKEMPIPLPPLSEQQQIVAEVEWRLSIAQAIDAQIEANLKRSSRLRQSILKRAFEGRLVPQDPDDEPASVLLERVRARGPGDNRWKKISKTKARRS